MRPTLVTALLAAACVSLAPAMASAQQSGQYSSAGVAINNVFTGNRASGTVPVSSSFLGSPIGFEGFEANGSSEQAVKRAGASFRSLSSDTSGVTPTEFGSLSGSVSGSAGSTSFPGFGVTASLSGNGFELAVVRPSVTRLVQFGVFFDRSLAVNLIPDPLVVATYVKGFAAANSITDQDAEIELRLGRLYSESLMRVEFMDRTDRANNMSYDVFSSWRADYYVQTSLAHIADGVFTAEVSDYAGHGLNLLINESGVNKSEQLFATAAAVAPLEQTAAYVTTQPYWLRDGRTYEMAVRVGCRIDVSDAARFFVGSSADCDATRSGYWNGIVSAVDESGAPASLPDLFDENGINYRFPSPLSPGGGGVVPEPATLALLGLGLAGLAASRRRKQ